MPISLYARKSRANRLQVFHENIVRSISSGVFTTDREGSGYLVQSRAAHEVTGYAFADVQGRLWQEVFNWHPTDGAQTTR